MYEFAKAICQPYFFLILGLGGVLAYCCWRPPKGRKTFVVLMTLWLGVFCLSLPVVSYTLIGSLEWQFPPRTSLPDNVDALVLLSGGTDPPNAFRDRAVLTGSSFARCLYAADLYQHLGGRPLVVCGGQTDPATDSPPEAEVIRDALANMGVDYSDITLEDRSRSTHENAMNAAAIVRQRNWQTVAIVTHARHMPRAVMCFRKQGVGVIAAPCGYKTGGSDNPYYSLAIPSPGALDTSHEAIREWVGICWYWLRGRI